MERVLTRWWQRAARRWPVVALLTALAATGGAVAPGASSPTHPAAHHPAAHHPAVRTAQANEEAATNDAASLLASLNLPSDAVRQATEPAGDDGTLAQPVSAPATPNAVDDHAWWVVPATTSQVLQYVKSHPPAGGASDFSGAGGGRARFPGGRGGGRKADRDRPRVPVEGDPRRAQHPVVDRRSGPAPGRINGRARRQRGRLAHAQTSLRAHSARRPTRRRHRYPGRRGRPRTVHGHLAGHGGQNRVAAERAARVAARHLLVSRRLRLAHPGRLLPEQDGVHNATTRVGARRPERLRRGAAEAERETPAPARRRLRGVQPAQHAARRQARQRPALVIRSTHGTGGR